MNKVKRLVALLLMLTMAVSVFITGCGSKKDEEGNASSSGTQDSAVASGTQGNSDPYAEKLELTWIGHILSGYTPKENSEVQKLIEEKFNVTIKPAMMDYTNEDQWNLYWASGNTADFITNYGGISRLSKLADQGLIREISFDMIKTNMPTWLSKVESYIDEDTVKKMLTYNGKMYNVPYTSATDNMAWVTGVRKDWMANVGITKAPSTLDELHDMLTKFVRNDPDKNGKDDTYGLHGTSSNNGLSSIFAAYGIQPDSYYVNEGKVYYTSVSEEYKQALKTLAAWFKEGLIDPEFVTDDRSIQRKKWSDGKFGYLSDNPWWFANSTAGNLVQMVTDKNPSAEIEYIEPVKGSAGQSGAFAWYPGILGFSFGFGKDTSDEKIERIMAIKEELANNWDFYTRCYYGTEGKTYTKDKDGIIAFTEEYKKFEKQVELGLNAQFALIPPDMEHFKKITPLADMPPYEVSFKSEKSYRGVTFVTSGASENEKIKSTDVGKIRDEFYYNAITGKVDIDKEWDSYVKKINSVGLTDIVNDYQVLYDTANK